MEKEKIILGIDPGTTVMGFGIISIQRNDIKLIAIHELILKKYPNHATKLKYIFDKTLALIDEYLPDEVALEAPFFGKNVQSMLKLGRAQGVAMAASLYRDIPITEYSPKEIKQAITGNGNASKEQVAGMLLHLLQLKDFPTATLDATDGLAVAVTHHFAQSSPLSKLKKGNSWEAFLKNNPDRIL
ncbi:crossover junction endodeoxyribonuclease RuvC [Bergeyella zoohelcum]|uniref:Crossover junction endodeoxyribonuclease RuvC n=1 Tax=Bergeyella zoohelcum TaxID=1015 RepID=A0A7Z8YQ43_9FLAO|nr:crossover junction endodeoxyribonuclease RuvC [Bergeyella zoohelcum]MDY6024811.1 crossover junction endodeoxyribonuclease RuvC [Bergeyella zoohelcum]VDH03373.1 Holliday junction resolvase [Bergeyella zoohelcum]